MNIKTNNLTVRLTPYQYQELNVICVNRNLSKSKIMRGLIDRFLNMYNEDRDRRIQEKE